MRNHPDLHLTGAIHCAGVSAEVVDTVLARPRLVALLAVLACATERWVRRDVLLPLLWPDADQARGRAALRKAVFTLRGQLGSEAIANRGSEEIGLGDEVGCDVVRIRSLLAAGDAAGALAEYGGDLLPGFHLSDAPEFERWLDQQRDQLRGVVLQSVSRALAYATARSERNAAADLARQVLRIEFYDEGLLRRAMEALALVDAPAEALRAYERFRMRCEQDLESHPSTETQQLAAQLRERITVVETPTPSNSLSASVGAIPQEAAATERSGLRMPRMAAVAFVSVLLFSLPWLLIGRTRESRREVMRPIAVSQVISYLPNDSVNGAAVMDMLATSLARVRGLPVFSTMRLYEVSRGDASAASLARAARRLGAAELLEGALHRGTSGVRLELRRVDAASGAIIASYTAEAPDISAAVNRATVQIAGSLGLPAPTASIASVTTTSGRAYELYEAGLRAWYRVDIAAAREGFRAAVAEDSTFAMATWMLANALAWEPEWIPTFERAVRLSERATDRERLMIRASYAAAMESPARHALADTLARRYPQEPSGHQLIADALFAEGRFLDAIPHIRRVIQLDTLSLLELTARCIACDAMWSLGAAYAGGDSLEAQMRVWREWTRVAPGSAAAASWLAYAYESAGRHTEAENSLRRMYALDPDYDDFQLRLAGLRLHAGEYDAADSLLVLRRRSLPGDKRAPVFWHFALLRINEGRYRDALAYADSFRLASSNPPRIRDAYLRVIVLLNAGDGIRAAELLDSMAAQPFPYAVRSRLARDMTMNRAHYADALALTGALPQLALLEDSVRRWGAQSGYMRDRVMHAHVRGLRHMLAGRNGEAATEFSSSQFGERAGGYARTNLMLARVLIADGRAREALRPLRLTLESNIGADKAWISRTEARELLGLAHDQLGNPDSARAHYQAVMYAWRRADASLHGRRQVIAKNLHRLQPGD